jgi:hypothetical protein
MRRWALAAWFICNDISIIFPVSPQGAFDGHNENR